MYKDSTEERFTHRNNNLHDDLEKLKALLLDTTRDAGSMLNQTISEAKDKTVAAQDNVEHYIAEKPFKALGAALFAGWLIGMWMKRSHKK